jgi:chromosome segregation ATPase
MRLIYLTGLLMMGAGSISCGGAANNQLPPQDPTNPEYEKKFEALEKEVGALNQTTEFHSDDFKLTHDTMTQCKEYLSVLYENINATREDHLPEWQQMFAALTSREAMTDPEFKIGNPPFATNFYLQNLAITSNTERLDAAASRLERLQQDSQTQTSNLRDLTERVSTIDGTIGHINATLQAKFQAIDKVLEDYNGRVRAIEERMVAVDTRVGVIESRVGAFDSRLRALEQQLTTYNIPGMDRRLRTAEATLTNHTGSIIELQAGLSTTQGELGSVREDLRGTQEELTRSTNELRQLIRSYHPE